MKKVIDLLKKKLEVLNIQVSLAEKGHTNTVTTKLNRMKSFILELQQAIDILEKSESKNLKQAHVIKSVCRNCEQVLTKPTQGEYCTWCGDKIYS